jgi:hypothetical protein
MDLALSRAATGWRLYAQFAAAGAVANLAAFALRMALPGGGRAGAAGQGGQLFWPGALVSFIVCGAVAGLACGALWFRTRPRWEADAPR